MQPVMDDEDDESRAVPVTDHKPRSGEQVIKRRGIKPETRIAIAAVRLGQPAGIQVTSRDRIVKGKCETKVIREIEIGRNAPEDRGQDGEE